MKVCLIIASIFQLAVQNNHAFVPHHPFSKRHLAQEQATKSTGNADDFEIPQLDADVTCGDGRDMIAHIKHLHKSALDLTGRGIFERMDDSELNKDSSDNDIYQAICRNDRYVLISHGKQKDPVYNFGNRACLQAFARNWENLISMPSRLCVISKSDDEALRVELMRNVTNNGFVDGEYRGYRIRGDGKFIKLTECFVWNCYDNEETYIGQAALFDRKVSPVVDSTD